LQIKHCLPPLASAAAPPQPSSHREEATPPKAWCCCINQEHVLPEITSDLTISYQRLLLILILVWSCFGTLNALFAPYCWNA
jgi:hypothetical protein